MNLCALSTSARRGSVAIDLGEGRLAAVRYEDLQGHAERIFGALDGALADAGVTRAELGALACDIGPGSFTGVRVGVASAKGIALALGLPLVGVVSLEAMAAAALHHRAPGCEGGAVALIDAKKDEVFLAVYAPDLSVALAPAHVPRAAAAQVIEAARAKSGRIAVVGEFASELGVTGVTRHPELDLPDATWVARVARRRLESGAVASEVEPLYVRAPDAQRMA